MPRQHANKKKRHAAAKPSAASAANKNAGGVLKPGVGSPRKLNLKGKRAKVKDDTAKSAADSTGLKVGVLILVVGCLLMLLLPAPPMPEGGPGGPGGAPERDVPGAPTVTFASRIDATRRYGQAPTQAELDAAAGDAADGEAEEAAQDDVDADLSPAEKRAARRERKKKNRRDRRQAGFGSEQAGSDESDNSGEFIPLSEDPRFRQKLTRNVDMAVQAQFSSSWSPREACNGGAYDLECPAVHRRMHAEIPDSIMFECKADAECAGYPCVDGQCLCGGLSLSVDCNSFRLLHYEWSHNAGLQKSSAESRSGVPSLATFTNMLRGASPEEAIRDVLESFTLVQDPEQSPMDAQVQTKLRPELEFLLRAWLETSPDGSVDLSGLIEAALETTMQTTIWMSKNLIRYVPMPRALRLGVQAHGEKWFYDTVAEVLRWTQHPAAAPVDYSKQLDTHAGHNLLSLATHWQLYGAMQLILAHDGGNAPGALQYAIRNHDIVALKILLDGENAVDALDEKEKDAFARSPLELAEVSQDMAFDDVLGHLQSKLGVARTDNTAAAPTKKRRRKKSDDGDAGQPAKDSSSGKKYGGIGGRFFEKAGTDVQINCPVDEIDASELTVERFLRDYVQTGRPLVIKGGADDWDITKFRLDTLPQEIGEADVAANHVPYGDQLGVESHHMKLRDYLGYIQTLNAGDDELPLVVYDPNLLDSNVLSDGQYRPGSRGVDGGDKFYHPSRYHWMGEGTLADMISAVSTPDTPRWSHFFAGPKDGGAGLNVHCSVFSTLSQGKQLWIGFPPSQPGFGSAYSSQHPLEWMQEVNKVTPEVLQGGGRNMQSPLVCELQPGYTLYSPPLWATAAINLEPTLGVNIEVVNDCVL